MSYYGWKPYVSVAERKKIAAKKIAKLNKQGKKTCPVLIEGRSIAQTFWGKSWCKHLETYQDYENRLPRGRSYVRNGSVIDLKIKKGCIEAMVQGSSLYTVNITINVLKNDLWQELIKKCTGKIDSVIELLQGKLSDAVMEVIINKDKGLFPQAYELTLSCSCPDYASMCKHVAATLYGVGSRLDEKPEQLFLLRQVDHFDLIASATSSKKLMKSDKLVSAATVDEADLSALFGIDIDKQNIKAKKSEAKKSGLNRNNKADKKTVATKKKKPNKKKLTELLQAQS